MIGRAGSIFLSEAGPTLSQMMGSEAPFMFTGDWQQVKVENLTPVQADCDNVLLWVKAYTQHDGYTWYVDGAQIEKNEFATPYIETDGAPASRLAGEGPVGRALVSQKPAGIIMQYSVLTGQSWANVDANHADWAAVAADYATWDDVRTDT